MGEIIAVTDLIIRGVALAGFGLAAIVAGTHWAVRQRKLNPFGGWAKMVRRASDPVLRPIERRLVQSGRNPQDGSLWLLGFSIVAGVGLVAMFRWLLGLVFRFSFLMSAGPAALVAGILDLVINLIMLALLVRVLASWFAVSPRHPAMRPVVWLTEWLLGPIRRRLPPMGFIDLSPVVAYFILLIIQALLPRVVP
jgi:YggT family protein